jgi:hypothetical protein
MERAVLKYVILLLAASRCGFGQSARPMDVCQVLQSLSELNGRMITIRGVLGAGDTGQGLSSPHPCRSPVVRDGWVWREMIALSPTVGGAAAAWIPIFDRMSKAHSPDGEILGTVTGRLTTRDHFDLQTLVDGSQRPRGFGWAVAWLSYDKVRDLEAVHIDRDYWEWWDEIHRHPYAQRAK